MDTQLPLHQRLVIRIHLLYCVWCRRYAHQIRFLRTAAKGLAPEANEVAAPKLSEQAKEQMRKRLEEALNNPPSSPH
jgi:hypothetical protein